MVKPAFASRRHPTTSDVGKLRRLRCRTGISSCTSTCVSRSVIQGGVLIRREITVQHNDYRMGLLAVRYIHKSVDREIIAVAYDEIAIKAVIGIHPDWFYRNPQRFSRWSSLISNPNVPPGFMILLGSKWAFNARTMSMQGCPICSSSHGAVCLPIPW